LAVEPAAERVRAERIRMRVWLALGAAQSAAATFDAWSTRQAIAGGAHEINPMLRPFAGNGSIYAAIHAGPLVIDYVSRRMMASRHAWMRRAWWVPQAMGIAVSLGSGIHNLGMN
jgi:hypothetical protein